MITVRPAAATAATATRKTTNVWLIGQQSREIPGNRLPSKREVMTYFFHLHLTEKKTVQESVTLAAEAAFEIWDKARIPTRLRKHVIAALKKIFHDWQKLKKNENNKKKRSKTLVEIETAFSNSLNDLFEIAHAEALSLIKIEEDRNFLSAQREKGRREKMVGVDKALEKQETRTMERAKKYQDRLVKSRKKTESEPHVILCSSSSSSDSEEVDRVSHQSSTPAEQELASLGETSRKRGRKQFMTLGLASVLDRTKVSDRNATALLYIIGESLGRNMSQFSVNRSLIRRNRIQQREKTATEIISQFDPTVPLVVHWDGKLLPDLTGKKDVDRLPILVTGDGVEKMLSVPKIAAGTGLEIGKAVVETLELWNITEKVKGMCFDTTASNTGRKNGACVLIEQKLDKDLLYLACRHHIFELVLEAVFSVSVTPSASPEILIFKKFQACWPSLDKAEYRTALDDEFTAGAVADIKDEIITFAIEQLNHQQPRDYYRELLEISITFLGSDPPRGIRFLAPGAMHKARWMAKAIYAIKIWMFKGQFPLRKKEEAGIRNISIFVVRFYLKAWFEAQLPTAAPLNDLLLLKNLQQYKTANSTVANAALKKLAGHLWYLSEELVAFAFFDERVPTDTKAKMIQALQNEGNEDIPKRVTFDQDSILEKNLDYFVSANTLRFFDILGLDSKFTELDLETWPSDVNYIATEKCIRSIKCVNDSAERGVALIEEYNRLHTQDEQQHQLLRQVVSDHRRRYPDFRKGTLANNN